MPPTSVFSHAGAMLVVRVLAVLQAALLALLLLAPPAARAQDLSISTPRLVVDPGGWQFNSAGSLSGSELGKMIESSIGKGKYQQVTVMLSTCHSGAGGKTVGGALSGPSNVIASCSAGQTTVSSLDGTTGKLKGFNAALLDSVIADPKKPMDSHVDAGKTGEPRLPKSPGEEAAAKARYEAWREQRIKDNEERVKKGEKPLSVPPEWDKGGRDTRIQEPASVQSGGTPGSQPLAAGKKSNHAVIFRTHSGDTGDAEAAKTKEALKKAGFDSVTELTPMTKADYAGISGHAGGDPPPLRKDAATAENLKKALDDLAPVMNADEHLAVIVIAHGGVTTASNDTRDNPGAGQGAQRSLASPLDRFGDSMAASWLAEEALGAAGALITDDYLYTRFGQPALVIQTLQEFSASGTPVQVAINGVFVGSLVLQADGPGHLGLHVLPLDDRMIAAIVNGTDIGAGLEMSFGFGGPGDFFQLATEADGLPFGRAGMELQFSFDGSAAALIGLPLPSSVGLVILALAGLMLPWLMRRGDRGATAGSVVSPPSRLRRHWVVQPLQALVLAMVFGALTPPAHALAVLACGGSRASESHWLVAATGASVEATLAGSTYAEVTLTGPGEAQAEWVSGMMFGHIEGIGDVRLRHDPARLSGVAIHALDPANPFFFPALAEQTLFWLMEVVDAQGQVVRTLRNEAPMSIAAVIDSIPPFGTLFPITEAVVFSDVTAPGVAVVSVQAGGSAGSLTDPGGLAVDLVAYQLDPALGQFEASWAICNLRGAAQTIHWFADGVHGTVLDGIEEQFNVALDATLLVKLKGRYDPNDPLGGVVLHASSVPGAARAEGHDPVYFSLLAVPLPSSALLLLAVAVAWALGQGKAARDATGSHGGRRGPRRRSVL